MSISSISWRVSISSLIAVVLTFGMSTAAIAADPDGDIVEETPAVAPAEDGTGGGADISDEAYAGSYRSGEEESGTTYPPKDEGGVVAPVCDAGSTWYRASAYKHGRVTRWDSHYKNDSTLERFTWTTSTTKTVSAYANTSGSIDGNVAIKKIASISLGTTTGIGLSGEVASTYNYSREVTFDRPGKWVIYRGHLSGSGSVTRWKCYSNESGSYQIGSAKPFTFLDGSSGGLINCANSVTDRIAKNAKLYC
ncbi:hypothetical protein ACIA03_02950 [Nocardioides sp. NPDC051685]|uniref:hypothetical protein n=1 Tax=Nocardioides sp. NPDC051685 TaxID=3364334 RepID=UPI0037BDE8B9